jgi:protein SCO1/2
MVWRAALRARATAAWIGVVSLVVGGSAACGPPDGGRVVSSESGAIDIKVARPAFTLTDTDGKPFDFAARTAGKLTFLEFGYTNCPDVCPVHMANLAAVLKNLSPTERQQVMVVFVSVDPDRDSLPVLRKWLDAFDRDFIGLTGSREVLNAVQSSVGFGPAIVQAATETTPENVTHAAPVLVFTADDTAHVMYPFGTRQTDWTRDMPRLLAKRGSASAGARAPSPAAKVDVERAYIVLPAGNAPAAVYFVARNPGAQPDSLRALSIDALGTATLHETAHDHATNVASMRAVTGIEVPPRGALQLAPGGFHGMLSMQRRPTRGERVPITLSFAKAGTITVNATVIAYADVDTATAKR